MQAAKRKEDEEKHNSLQTMEGKFTCFHRERNRNDFGPIDRAAERNCIHIVDRRSEQFGSIHAFDVIDMSCSIFFMVELALRIYSVARVREGGVIPYFMEPLNLLDLALVVLDVVILLIGADETSANAGKIARELHVLYASFACCVFFEWYA